jgi:hypothetical protein
MPRPPLSLSNGQLAQVRAAATVVPVEQRDQFLRALSKNLGGQPSDIEITQAINVALNRTPVFLCDSAQQKEAIMARHHHHDDDDDAPRSRAVIPDGGSVRVKMHMMDGLDPVQRAIAARPLVTDADGGTAGLHRPGPRYIADAAMRDAKQAAYDAYLHDVTNAWRGAPTREYPASAEGSTCTVRGYKYRDHFGAPGTVISGECVPDALQRDALPTCDRNMTLSELQRDHQVRMAEEYAAHDRALSERWRMP